MLGVAGVRVEAVEVVATKQYGEGIASTADRTVLDLTPADRGIGDLHRDPILKTMLRSPHPPPVTDAGRGFRARPLGQARVV